MHTKVLTWLSIAALLSVLAFWNAASAFQLQLNLVICVAATAVLIQAFQAKKYRWAAEMIKIRLATSTLLLVSVCGVVASATAASDLSKYRGFQFGTDLPAVVKQVGADMSQVKVIHTRPALIQTLEWHPRSLGPAAKAESVGDVVFSFYNGALYRVAVNYDRYEVEGLTTEDMVGALSLIYGAAAAAPIAPAKAVQNQYGDQQEVLARWEDSQYSFDLLRSSYGPSFQLIGVQRTLDSSAQSAISEAKRLDDQEAPQREAARAASEQEAANAKLEKARLVNKPRFRP